MPGAGKRVGRKLLIASIGVATVTYQACSSEAPTTDAAADVAPHADATGPHPDAGVDRGLPVNPTDARMDRQFIGNIV